MTLHHQAQQTHHRKAPANHQNESSGCVTCLTIILVIAVVMLSIWVFNLSKHNENAQAKIKMLNDVVENANTDISLATQIAHQLTVSNRQLRIENLQLRIELARKQKETPYEAPEPKFRYTPDTPTASGKVVRFDQPD